MNYMIDKVITARGLTKYYGKSRGIDNLDLDVLRGEIYGFIGPNGAEKSTAIRCLLGYLHADSGRAIVLGQNIINGTKGIKNFIGYVPADVNYYPDMKVKDFLKYSASFYRQDSKARINYLAEALSINMDKKFEDLSTGNKKKVAIAQALLHDPELLILDEPSSGLDPLMQKIMFDLIREENRKGTTVLFSSHVLSEVQRMCSRIGMVKDGRIFKEVTAGDLSSVAWANYRIECEDELSITLPGVKSLEKNNNIYTFIYSGDADALIKELSKHKIKSLYAGEPELEEIFLHYYK